MLPLPQLRDTFSDSEDAPSPECARLLTAEHRQRQHSSPPSIPAAETQERGGREESARAIRAHFTHYSAA